MSEQQKPVPFTEARSIHLKIDPATAVAQCEAVAALVKFSATLTEKVMEYDRMQCGANEVASAAKALQTALAPFTAEEAEG